MDGRDVPPSSGKDYVKELMAKLERDRRGPDLPPSCGRYYAMDRDNRWDRVEKAYDAMVLRRRALSSPIPVDAMQNPVCRRQVTDEFVVPAVCCKGGEPLAKGDSVIFFNFRPDRAREITRTLVDPDFDRLCTRKGLLPASIMCASPSTTPPCPTCRWPSSPRRWPTPLASTSPRRA